MRYLTSMTPRTLLPAIALAVAVACSPAATSEKRDAAEPARRDVAERDTGNAPEPETRRNATDQETRKAKAEAELLWLTNQSRSTRGLRPLQVDPVLETYAREHSARMAARRSLVHSTQSALRGIGLRWTRVGENIAFGMDATQIHEQFMQSPRHRDNILGPYDVMGIGVDTSRDGYLYVTVVFIARQ